MTLEECLLEIKKLKKETKELSKINNEQAKEYRKQAQFKCFKEGFAVGAAAMADEIRDKLTRLIQQITELSEESQS